MPFLTKQKSNRYHIRSSEFVRLDTKPTKNLALLLKPLTFYKNLIKIPITHNKLIQELEGFFQISLLDNKITNKLLLRFFLLFCETKLLENY